MRELVRCPYCVLGAEFRPTVAHVDGRYICGKCGQTVFPSKPEYKCQCFKCFESWRLPSSSLKDQKVHAQRAYLCYLEIPANILARFGIFYLHSKD